MYTRSLSFQLLILILNSGKEIARPRAPDMAAMTPVQGWAAAARKTATAGARPVLLMTALLMTVFLQGCADRFAGYAPVPGAVQHPHPQGVAQLARDGTLLTQFDAPRALLPLALGGALVDYRNGLRQGFRDAYAAGFNAVVPDPGQPLTAVRAAAEGSHLLALHDATPGDGAPQDGAVLLDARPAWLVPVNTAADLDRLAVAVRTAPGRPVWALLRAHADAARDRPMPDPAAAGLFAFGALASGASGLVWQGEDNYAARNAGMMGIAAAPPLDYGIRTDPDSGRQPYRATPDDIAASRRLWDAVARLNRRIEKLAPMLLRPDAPDGYTLAVADGEDGRGLRSLLKPWDGANDPRRLLLVVNAGETAARFRIAFDRPLASIERWQEDDSAAPDADAARGLIRDHIAARSVRLYRITLR